MERLKLVTHQVKRVYGGHLCHFVRQDGPEVGDVAGGETQGVQLGQLCVGRYPGQRGLQAAERLAQDTHTRPFPRVRCVPLLRLLARAHPVLVITEVRARAPAGSTHCTTSSARHALLDTKYCCTARSNPRIVTHWARKSEEKIIYDALELIRQSDRISLGNSLFITSIFRSILWPAQLHVQFVPGESR